MRIREVAAVTTLAATLALAACGDAPVGAESATLSFVVSGPIDNRTGAPIPEGARVVVLWAVSSSDPDHAYIHGHGTIDRTTNTFSVTFDAPPPAEALNQPYGIGIGFVVATTDAGLGEGRLSGALDESTIIGLSGQHAVIYLRDDPASAPAPWLRSFRRGFNVGEGITIPDSDYDGFAPVAPNALQVILDDLANITVVNWT